MKRILNIKFDNNILVARKGFIDLYKNITAINESPIESIIYNGDLNSNSIKNFLNLKFRLNIQQITVIAEILEEGTIKHYFPENFSQFTNIKNGKIVKSNQVKESKPTEIPKKLEIIIKRKIIDTKKTYEIFVLGTLIKKCDDSGSAFEFAKAKKKELKTLGKKTEKIKYIKE